MAQWFEELRAALGELPADQPAVMTLATVDPTGGPRARSVIARRLGDDGSVVIASDARSGKGHQLRRNPRAEAVVWLPPGRVQFRLHGEVEIVSDVKSVLRRSVWQELPDTSRALFFWPQPVTPRQEEAERFPTQVAVTAEPPEHFELLILRPTSVDRLDIGTMPHRRKIWLAADGWAGREVNP